LENRERTEISVSLTDSITTIAPPGDWCPMGALCDQGVWGCVTRPHSDLPSSRRSSRRKWDGESSPFGPVPGVTGIQVKRRRPRTAQYKAPHFFSSRQLGLIETGTVRTRLLQGGRLCRVGQLRLGARVAGLALEGLGAESDRGAMDWRPRSSGLSLVLRRWTTSFQQAVAAASEVVLMGAVFAHVFARHASNWLRMTALGGACCLE